jgi:nucleotide-binding universal stress UspA family protein
MSTPEKKGVVNMKHIMVATDFSKNSALAERRAATLALEHGAKLTLLHVVSGLALERLRQLLLNGCSPSDIDLIHSFEVELQQIGESLMQEFNIMVHTRLEIGNPHDNITRIAHASDADLIVVGAAGTHAVREFFLGATAEDVICQAQLPTLVIRLATPNQHRYYQQVIAAVDLSPFSTAVVALACRVAPKANLTLAHTFTVEFERKLRYIGASEQDIQHYRKDARQHAATQLQALAEKLPTQTMITSRLEHGLPEYMLPSLVKEIGADLLVVGKHDTSEIEELLLGSVTRHLLFEASCDVLVLPEARHTV